MYIEHELLLVNQYLYILSKDDEIKVGDYYLNGKHLYQADRFYERAMFDKKIIATSNSSLSIIKENAGENNWVQQLPQIPTSFVWNFNTEFIKGNTIEKVLVKYEIDSNLTINPDNTINIKIAKEMFSREEVIVLLSDWTRMKTGLNTNLPVEKFNNWIEENL